MSNAYNTNKYNIFVNDVDTFFMILNDEDNYG